MALNVRNKITDAEPDGSTVAKHRQTKYILYFVNICQINLGLYDICNERKFLF